MNSEPTTTTQHDIYLGPVCRCGREAYRPNSVTTRRLALRCSACHRLVGRCRCTIDALATPINTPPSASTGQMPGMTNDEAQDWLLGLLNATPPPHDAARFGAAIRAIRAKAIADAREWMGETTPFNPPAKAERSHRIVPYRKYAGDPEGWACGDCEMEFAALASNEPTFTGQMTWPCECGHVKSDHYFGDKLGPDGHMHTWCQLAPGHCMDFRPRPGPR